jgi:ABC-2 type transport system ATP-binding protein
VGRIRRAIGGTRRRRVTTIVLVVALLILTGIGLSVSRSADAPAPTALTLPGGPTSASDPTPVQLEVDLYLPPDLQPGATAPAVLLAHGFGGSKASIAQEAAAMANAGFVTLAYSARGFGASTGQISMNAPEFEVADASALLDHLATVPEVSQDATGDPRVGVAGGSYGGALALMLAGYDPRVDAVAADITWNSLEGSLFGQAAIASSTLGASSPRASSTLGASSPRASSTLGAYKSLWSGFFFSSGQATPGAPVTECGRFTEAWCRAYAKAAVDGTVDPADAELMFRSSPASITDRITAPTLLGGGQADSLFPLDQVNANAEQIMTAHPDVPVKVVWHAGGHDGALTSSETVTEQVRALTTDWFGAHLADGPAVSDAFLYSVTEGSALSDRAAGSAAVLSTPDYTGLNGTTTDTVTLAGPPQQALAPAGGVPAAISSVPGLGGVGSLLGQLGGGALAGLAQQTATFVSEPLAATTTLVGAPTAGITLSSDRPVPGATVFTALRILDASGRAQLPASLVAPVRVDALGPDPQELQIRLPAIVTDIPAGSRLALTVTTTDQAYRMPSGPAVYTVALADTSITVPTVAGTPVESPRPPWLWPLLALVVLVIVGLLLRITRPRPASVPSDRDPVDPVIVTGLVKQYPGGVRAVDGVDFTVPRGIVLGLLGPNGAGKSTTMRMMMGLITPTAGDVRIFGETIRPGSPALVRVGCFIEGPGLLPHLTGRQNLDLFWRASGRSGDPRMIEVLEIAGLGSAIDRRVRTYSQGMRQRVGIAQAMLGMPDLLLLDEPTNGLDPPQIKEMREVLQAYAKDGRTVIVSSHLLSEVEQTCSDVVVMGAGRVIAQGSVDALLSEHQGRRLEDVFLGLVGEGHSVTTSGVSP